MTVYCGVDFHARCQTVSYCDTADGEVHQQDLHHQKDDVRAFYRQFSGEVIVGLEASGYPAWFEELLEGLGHQVWVGDATEIRRLLGRESGHTNALLTGCGFKPWKLWRFFKAAVSLQPASLFRERLETLPSRALTARGRLKRDVAWPA